MTPEPGLRVDLLADHVDAIPTIATWHHNEWHHQAPGVYHFGWQRMFEEKYSGATVNVMGLALRSDEE